MNSGFISQLEPPVLAVSLVKSEPLVIKNEPLESEFVENGMDDILNESDIKDMDIVSHTLCEGLIKSETISENVFETVFVKTENVKIENIIDSENLIKTKDTSNDNGQQVVEIQAINEHSYALSNLKTDEQSILNFSKRSRKSKSPKKTDFAECYKTDDTTLWEKEKTKIKVIKAPVIPVEAHEYTSLAKDKHICNHCQLVCNTLNYIKTHIKKIHREVTTMYQCPYCPYKSKWRVREHIICKHKDIKDVQWFQCHLCEVKFKLKSNLTQHMKVNLNHKQIQDELDLRRYHCDNCDYKTYRQLDLKSHKLNHLKPEDIPYFHCYHCSYKSNCKRNLKRHIFGHHFKNVIRGKRLHCNKCNYKTYTSTHLKNHKLTHLKPEEIQYFYCYHCSYKTNLKGNLKGHIFRHFKKEQVKFDCYNCNFITSKRESIIKHIKKHSKVQNKSEINEGS